jgi:hypothetical protein
MKQTIAVVVFCFSLLLTSCTHKTHPQTGGLPPGQAKKVTGSKSAKPYAPGQQKKN